MQTSTISQHTYSAPYGNAQGRIQTKQEGTRAETQHIKVTSRTQSVIITSEYDLTNMTSEDMLSLARSFYEEGNKQDFLSMAVYSARAALEDHPDPFVAHTWTTPRNENGTFNVLAEIQATPKYATGSSHFDAENKADREHLLHTLLTLPSRSTTIAQSSMHIINISV